MRCAVNGAEVPSESLARQTMNFSQPWPDDFRPLAYSISVDCEEFVKRFGGIYDRCVREEKADIPHHELGDFPVLDRWQVLGYPTIEELLASEPVLLEGLVHWLSMEALDCLLPGPHLRLPKFLVNSVAQVMIRNGLLTLEGRAYEHALQPQVSR